MSRDKYKKALIISFVLAITMVAGFNFYTILQSNLKDRLVSNTIELWNSSPKLSTDKKYPVSGGFNGIIKDVRYGWSLTDSNLFNPKITFVKTAYYEYEKTDVQPLDIYVFNYTLKGFNSYELSDFSFNTSQYVSFESMLELSKRNDITTNFRDKESFKITNHPPLTQAEIDQAVKIREEQIEYEKNIERLGGEKAVACLAAEEIPKAITAFESGQTEIETKIGLIKLSDGPISGLKEALAASRLTCDTK